MNWIAWLLLSNVSIFWLEYVYRSAKYGSFFHAIPYIAIPVLVSQAGLYYGFRLGPSLIVVGITFTIINVLLRMVNVVRLGEHLGLYQVLALLLMVVASWLAKK